MVIEKNSKVYTVTECRDKWTVKNESERLTITFEVSKMLCSTSDELCEYILNNNDFF